MATLAGALRVGSRHSNRDIGIHRGKEQHGLAYQGGSTYFSASKRGEQSDKGHCSSNLRSALLPMIMIIRFQDISMIVT